MSKKELLIQIILDLDVLNCALNIDVGSGYCDDELDKYIKLLDEETEGNLLNKGSSKKDVIKSLSYE